MIRKSTLPLNSANVGKLQKLRELVQEYQCVIQAYIDRLWEWEIFQGSFVKQDILDEVTTWLSAAAKQCAGKQALQIVKSQRKKKNKTKPELRGNVVELDSRLLVIQEGRNKFDLWITFRGLGKYNPILLPAQRHKHFLGFTNWERKKSARLRIEAQGLFLDVFFEQEAPKPKSGFALGLDCGYLKLAVTSDGQVLGTELSAKAEKISRKTQGSKAFKRALIERDQYIDYTVKQLDLMGIGTIVVEALKNVKHKSKGKIQRKVMNKLQRWTYPRFLSRLSQWCEISGVRIHSTAPAYTSQQCSSCGFIHKENRAGESFRCGRCGHAEDADFNASKNILNRFIFPEATEPGLQVVPSVC